MAVPSTPGTLLAGWRRHGELLGNAASLLAATGVTAGLGFTFWTFAARLFSPRAVGYGSAAVSAMTLLGTIGVFGLGTVLIGELPRRRCRAGLVCAALLASAAGSLILGLGFSLAAEHVSSRFVNISGTPGEVALFTAGVVLTAVTMVFDQATIGLLRGGLQLSRNIAFAVSKVLALPAAALVLHDALGVGIALAWVASLAASLIPVAIRLLLAREPILPRPDWAVLRGLGQTAMAHNWLNLAIQVPSSLIPVLVTVIISPSANAAFYVAWTLSSFLYIVPTHLSTVLFAVATGDPSVLARKLRLTLRVSLLTGVPAMAFLGLGAQLALSAFGASYVHQATVPLRLLVLAYLPVIPRVHYIAVCRATGRTSRAAVVLTTAAVVEVGAAVAGGLAAGLNGLSLALLAVFIAEGVVTAPAVLRAARRPGRHRLSEPGVPAGT
jgi:O-antigen/teichoic acid export membrane protein